MFQETVGMHAEMYTQLLKVGLWVFVRRAAHCGHLITSELS